MRGSIKINKKISRLLESSSNVENKKTNKKSQTKKRERPVGSKGKQKILNK